MEHNRTLIVSAVILSIGFFSAQAIAEETAQETRARELCTETAAEGAYPRWSVKEGMTCENSFVEACTIVRNKDGVEVTHQCNAPAEETAAEEAPDNSGDDSGGSSSSPRPSRQQ